MPGSTTRVALPYPLGADAPDTDGDLRELAEALDAVVALDAQGLASARPAAGVRGRYYFATDTLTLSRDTGSAWREVGTFVPVTFTSTGAAVVPLTLKGATSQTGNLLEVRDSAGTLLAYFTASGRVTSGRGLYVSGSDAGTGTVASLDNDDPARRVLALKGAAGQAGNLLELLTSAGVVLARFRADGSLAATVTGYREGRTVTGTSGTITLDLATANAFSITPTAAVTLALANASTTSTFTPVTLRIGSSAFAVTWPAGTRFAGGTAPTLSGVTYVSGVVGPDGVLEVLGVVSGVA